VKSIKSAHCGKQITAGHSGSTGQAKEYGGLDDRGCSKGAGDECAEILHGLNNVLASMLLNAQVMEWKLPFYSRSRRYLHEIERNAQRGGELVRRLLERLDLGCQVVASHHRLGAGIPNLAEEGGQVTNREAEVLAKPDALPPEPHAHSSQAFPAPQ